jgi:hypothetical protein
MAVKKNLEVVASLPKQPDLEELLAPRLADDLLAEVDMPKLAKLMFGHLGKRLKLKAIEWLSADTSAHIPLNEVDAIEAASEQVAA